MNRRENDHKSIKNSGNTGSTMIETLVSFTVLFVVLAALYGIVAFSSELYMRSVDISRLQQRFYREIYKKQTSIDDSFVEVKSYSGGIGSGKAKLILNLDTTKTNENNYNANSSIAQSSVNMSRISVNSYVCKEGTSTDGSPTTVIMPKAVMFSYDKE